MFGWREPYDDKEFLFLYDAGPLAVGRELLVPDIWSAGTREKDILWVMIVSFIISFLFFLLFFAVVARVSPTVKFQLGSEVNVIVLEIFKQDEPATVFIEQEITIKHE